MDYKKYFKDEIDFEILESVAYRWGIQDKNIQNIFFYAGSQDYPYILLFNFTKPSNDGLWGHCILGAKNWEDARQELLQVCSIDANSTLNKWLIFAHEISTENYLLGEYIWQDGKRTEKKKNNGVVISEDYSPVIQCKNIEDDFVNSLGDKDFIGDSWLLNEKGFNKFIVPDEPKVLYRRENTIIDQKYTNLGIRDIFPKHPLGKNLEDDPLFVAVKVRESLMNKEIKFTKHGNTHKQQLHSYVEKNYHHISKEKQKEIVSLVNDGFGHGGKR